MYIWKNITYQYEKGRLEGNPVNAGYEKPILSGCQLKMEYDAELSFLGLSNYVQEKLSQSTVIVVLAKSLF